MDGFYRCVIGRKMEKPGNPKDFRALTKKEQDILADILFFGIYYAI
jgi:hypothetical protein